MGPESVGYIIVVPRISIFCSLRLLNRVEQGSCHSLAVTCIRREVCGATGLSRRPVSHRAVVLLGPVTHQHHRGCASQPILRHRRRLARHGKESESES